MEQPEGGDPNTHGRGKVAASRCLVADLFVSQEEHIFSIQLLLFFETLSRYEGGREEGGAPCRGVKHPRVRFLFPPKRGAPDKGRQQ